MLARGSSGGVTSAFLSKLKNDVIFPLRASAHKTLYIRRAVLNEAPLVIFIWVFGPNTFVFVKKVFVRIDRCIRRENVFVTEREGNL